MSRLFFGVVLILSVYSGITFADEVGDNEPAPEPQLHFDRDPYQGEVAKAKALMGEKKWSEAIVLFRSALRSTLGSDRSDSGSVSLELDLTRALTYAGRREEALALLGQLIARKKGAAQKQMIERLRVLSRVFLTNASFQTYQDGMNLMLAAKYRAARERFEKALEQEPANIEILTRMSQCLVMEGDYDSAAERLRLARRLDPYEPEIRLWLGRALHQRGEIREALVELKSAYLDLSRSETAAIWYAEALFSFSQSVAANEILDDDLKRHPDHIMALIEQSKHRLLGSSPRDVQAAWQARKELQLATSRVAGPADAESARAQPVISSMGDLEFEQSRPEADIRVEIGKLMAEADNRIDGALPEK